MSYDSSADAYEASAVPWFRPLARELTERICSRPARCVLDVGTGTGLVLRLLRERLGAGAQLVGVDPSVPMLEHIPEDAGVLRVRAIAPGLPFRSGSMDAVSANLVLSHVSDPRVAIRDMARVTRPGGRIVFTAWAPEGDEEDEHRALAQPVLAEVAAATGVDHALPQLPAPWEEPLREQGFVREVAEAVSGTVTIERVSQLNRLTVGDLLAGWGGCGRYRRSVAMPDAWAHFVELARQRLLDEIGPQVTSRDDFWIATVER